MDNIIECLLVSSKPLIFRFIYEKNGDLMQYNPKTGKHELVFSGTPNSTPLKVMIEYFTQYPEKHLEVLKQINFNKEVVNG